MGPDLTVLLPFHPPFEWDVMLGYLALRAIPGVEVVAGSTYRRTVLVDGDPGVIEVTRGGDDHLLLRARFATRRASATPPGGCG